MSKKENTELENMTKSQAKRAARKKEVASAKKKAIAGKVTGYIVALLLVIAIGALIGVMIVKGMNKVTPIDDHSAGLDANGFITGVTAKNDIDLADYRNFTVPLSEVEYTDEDVDAEIESYRNSNKVISEEEGLKVKDGDVVNIAYVGTVDGKEFEGGSADSYDLGIGTGTFIEGFEEQLIGAENLSTFNVNVTFPEDYGVEELNGKDAVFSVTINGIYVLPDFTDEYVAEKFGDKASTVEEYRQYLKDSNYATNLKTYTETYLKDNSSVVNFNKKYLKTLKQIKKGDDMQSYEYTALMYKQYLGYDYYTSFEDYTGKSESEYDVSLIDIAKETYKENLIYQAILENEGVTVDAAYYKDYLAKTGHEDEYYANQVEMYGEPYVLQMAVKEKALEIASGYAKVQ
ncbi:MAG: FKBP-type peptidyl-prolyl cis-trans isomerase [Lachnospiraceae bacterium]|nr:FKBP-type peptidyl-prolyl cis-trans isomerase [Lachnospiraceae bacterium]